MPSVPSLPSVAASRGGGPSWSACCWSARLEPPRSPRGRPRCRPCLRPRRLLQRHALSLVATERARALLRVGLSLAAIVLATKHHAGRARAALRRYRQVSFAGCAARRAAPRLRVETT